MKGILRPVGITAGVLALALAGWSGAHAVAGLSPFDLTAATQHREAAAGHADEQEAAARPGATPEVEPTERAEQEKRNPHEVTPPEKPRPNASAVTSIRTFNLVGGTVTLSCSSSGSIMVDLVAPNPGFSVRTEHQDDGRAVEIRFEGSQHQSRLQAACAIGQVQLQELREESS